MAVVKGAAENERGKDMGTVEKGQWWEVEWQGLVAASDSDGAKGWKVVVV